MADQVQSSITIEAKTKGVDQATDSLHRLADAESDVVVASDKVTKAQTSVERAYDRLKRQIDSSYSNAQRLAQGQVTLTKALNQGKITTAEYALDLQQLTARFGDTGQAAATASNGLSKANSSAVSLGASVRMLSGVLAAVGAMQLARQFINLADQAANLDGKLRNVTSGAADLEQIQNRLFVTSQASASSYASNVDLFVRLTNATRELGVSQSEVLGLTDVLNKAFMVSGATASETQNALTQLSQGLAAGALRGDEFNSVAEQGQRVMMALADHLGVSTGALRKMAAEGKITSKVMLEALASQAEKINSEFENMPLTVERAAEMVSNAWLKAVGDFEKEFNVSGVIASSMASVAAAIEAVDFASAFTDIAKAAAVAGAAVSTAFAPAVFEAFVAGAQKAHNATLALNAAAMANPWTAVATAIVAASTALYVFRDDIHPISGDLATLGDYGRVAWDAIAEGASAAADIISSAWDAIASGVEVVADAIDAALGTDLFSKLVNSFVSAGETIVGWVKTPVNIFIAAWQTGIDTIEVAFNNLPAAVLGGLQGLVNVALEAISSIANKAISALKWVISFVNTIPGVALSTIEPLGNLEVKLAEVGGTADDLAKKINENWSTDHVGKFIDTVKGAGQAIRDAANAKALDREITKREEENYKSLAGAYDKATGGAKKLGSAIDDNTKKKKAGGRATKEKVSEYSKWLSKLNEATEKLQLEANAFGMSATDAERYRLTQEALNAAKKSGIAITDQWRQKTEAAIDANINAQQALVNLKKAQEGVNEAQDLVTASWVRGLEDMILKAESLQDAIKGIGDAWAKASLDALLTGKGPLAQFTGLASSDPNNPNAVGGIFGVLMGNQNKLLSQLPKQVQKGAEAGTLVGAYDGTKTGSFEANVASGVPAFMQQYGKQILGVGAGLTSLVGAYGVGAAGGSPGMAGLGGAISGGMGGLALASSLSLAAGPVGAIGAAVGTGISLFANQQAKKQAKEQRMAEAQAAYQDAIPQIQSFTAALRGEIVGSLQQTIDEVHQKANELGKVAFFAYQFDEVKRIENEFNAYVERTREEFRDTFDGTLAMLEQGGGLAGAFASAKNEMKSFGEELQTFVADTHYAFQWQGDFGQQAAAAAQKAALGLLEPVESLSAVQTAVQQLNGRASALSDVLVDLGMSSDEAARAIDDGVGRAMDALRSTFSDDLTAKLNEVEGKDYLNEARDAIAQMQQMYADAAALGLDEGERIWRYFGRTAQEIVNGAELTGDAFNELITKFPEMSGVVHEFVAAMDGALQSAADFNASVQAKIFGAEGKSYITTAMDLVKERDALRDMAEKVGGDMALVETYYSKAAQSIVDSSQLTGDAFAELLRWVPELNGHVNAFAAAVQHVGKTSGEFYEDMIDKVLGAQGKSYITDMRGLIRERDELTATAQQLGVDVGLVTQYFDLASQGIVDSAGLTGDAFADLLAWFPELASSLKEAGQAIEQTAAQIEAAARRLQGYEDRFFAATNDNSSLEGALRAFDRQAAADRAEELAAGGQHLVALERALAAERLGVMAGFAAQAVSAAESAVAAAQQNLQRAAQAAVDAAKAQVDAAQAAARAAADAVSQAQSRVDAAQQALERAQDAVRKGYEDQAAVLRDTVSRLQSFIKGIQDFKRSLVLDDALSPFSPAQRLAEAQRQYQDIAARAMSGDTDAMDQLERVSRDYLTEARGYYASSEAYYQAFNDVQAILDQASRTAQSQLSEAERQLEVLEAQIAALTRIDDTVLSIEQAQAELLAAQQDLVTAQQQQAQADSALSVAQANLDAVQSQMDALLGINNSVMSVEQAVRELGVAQGALAEAQRLQNDILAQQQAIANRNPNEMFVQQAYRDVFGREADAGGLAYWTNQMDVGASTAAQVLERMQWERTHGAMRLGGIVGGYAGGGIVGNGLYDVDSVLARYDGGGNIALAGGEAVIRAPSVNRDTLPTLAAINSTGRLPANDDSAKNEIRALRQEVSSLKNELKQVLTAGFGATVGAVSQTTGAVRGTTDAVTRYRIARP